MTPRSPTFYDQFSIEVFGYALEAIVDQMGLTLLRTAYSPLIRDSFDFASAITNSQGRLIAQGYSIPMNIGATADAVVAVSSAFDGTWSEGDVAIVNDPYTGGTHLNDVFIVAPVLHAGALVCYVVSVAHQVDVGGALPGSMWNDAGDIWAEGVRLRPTKIREHGRPNRTLVGLISDNVRFPDQLLGDLDAMTAACETGRAALTELIASKSPAAFQQQVEALWAQTNSEVLHALAEIPSGSYRFEDHIDDDGRSTDPILLRCLAIVDDQGVRIDFKGSSEQVATSLNSPLAFTRSCALIAVKCLLPDTVRNNDGFLRCVQVTAEAGSVLNPRFPAPCGNRGLTGYRVFDTVMGALSQTGSPRTRSAGEGGTATVLIEGGGRDVERFAVRQPQLGAWGAAPSADGIDGISNPCANLAGSCVELIERGYPIRIMRREFMPDSGGPGRFRGGLAIEAEIQLLCESGTASVRSDRRAFPPYGLAGGEAGSPSGVWVRRGEERTLLPPKASVALARGDAIILRLPGAGGYGEPRTRDPELVLADVREGKLTVRAAREQYQVAIEFDGSVPVIDLEATNRLRCAGR